tara:strand:- start:696 stop:905 length:210 start_codon:yes stop_codon:yes gene_type:complete
MSWEEELKTTIKAMMNQHTLTNKRIDTVERVIIKEIPKNKDLLQVMDKLDQLEQQIINLNAKTKGNKDA